MAVIWHGASPPAVGEHRANRDGVFGRCIHHAPPQASRRALVGSKFWPGRTPAGRLGVVLHQAKPITKTKVTPSSDNDKRQRRKFATPEKARILAKPLFAPSDAESSDAGAAATKGQLKRAYDRFFSRSVVSALQAV